MMTEKGQATSLRGTRQARGVPHAPCERPSPGSVFKPPEPSVFTWMGLERM